MEEQSSLKLELCPLCTFLLNALFKASKEECRCSMPDSKSKSYCEKVLTFTGKQSSCSNRQFVAYNMYSCERVISAVRVFQWCCNCLAPVIPEFLQFIRTRERECSVIWTAPFGMCLCNANNIKFLSRLKVPCIIMTMVM